MAKRFTASDKLKKKWIRALKPKYKLFWIFLLDECDAAGIYEIDLQIAKIYCGFEYSEAEIYKVFGDKLIYLDKNTKWFIPSFIEFQYGELSPNCKPHYKIIERLKKFELLDESLKIKGYAKGMDTPKDIDKEKEKEQERDKETKGKTDSFKMIEPDEIPFYELIPAELREMPGFCKAWQEWGLYRKERKKPLVKSAALKQLKQLENFKEPIRAINKSILRQWEGLFDIEEENATGKNRGGEGIKHAHRKGYQGLNAAKYGLAPGSASENGFQRIGGKEGDSRA